MRENQVVVLLLLLLLINEISTLSYVATITTPNAFLSMLKSCRIRSSGNSTRNICPLSKPQVYIRILNTVCSLGTTLLQSGTLIPEVVKPR